MEKRKRTWREILAIFFEGFGRAIDIGGAWHAPRRISPRVRAILERSPQEALAEDGRKVMGDLSIAWEKVKRKHGL